MSAAAGCPMSSEADLSCSSASAAKLLKPASSPKASSCSFSKRRSRDTADAALLAGLRRVMCASRGANLSASLGLQNQRAS